MNVAVYGMVSDLYGDGHLMPTELKQKVRYMFVYHYDEYMSKIKKQKDDFKFKYEIMEKRMEVLREKIDTELRT